MQLERLFRPRSIAVLGASEKPTIGRRLVASLDRIGYPGAVYPVNPNYRTVLGHECWPDLAALPQAPDLALLCMGHRRVLEPLATAARCGVRAAIIYDGGFAEAGEEGRRLQARVADLCRETDIALCGPNCMGVLSPHHPSTSYLQELRDPAGLAGNVGLVSQSGSVCVSLLTDLRRFGFSHIVSSGNEAVLAAADYLDHLAGDLETRIIGAFIETVRDKERFAAALGRAARHGKPVAVLKVGRAARARRAITSHTGGDAGDDAETSALLRAHGAIEVADLVELTEVLAAFQGTLSLLGRRFGIVTSSGGLAELILDLRRRPASKCHRWRSQQKPRSSAQSASSAVTATRSTPGVAAPSPPTCRRPSPFSTRAQGTTLSCSAATTPMASLSTRPNWRAVISICSSRRRRRAASRITC
jgi:acetate---CoA ligase (ADP-forming)